LPSEGKLIRFLQPPKGDSGAEEVGSAESAQAEEALRQGAQELSASNEALLRSNEELRAIKEQLQLITSNMAAAVSRCSSDLRYVWVNRGYAAWLGRPPEEIAGHLIRDVIGDEGYENIRPYMERVLTGERVEYNTQVNFSGLGKRWIHAVYVPTYSGENQVDGWIAVVTDITDEKRRIEQLRAADERIKVLVANSSDGFVLLDEHASVLFSGAPVLGYTHDEWLGRNMIEILHPDDGPGALAKFGALLNQPGATITVRSRARHKDTSWRWIEAICRNLLDNPAVHGIVVNYRDITANQRIEDSLREQNQLLELTQDAILSLSWNGQIEFWNRGAVELYGWTRDEAIGKNAHELLQTQFPEPLADIKEKLARSGYWQGELVHTGRGGGKRTVASRWALRLGSDDQPTGYLQINTDITERKLAEEQLRQTQRLESLGILAGGIAHDFNNLLVGVLGNASLARDVLSPDTPARPMLDDLITACERAAGLTRQMLAYAGKEQLATQSVDVSAAVRELTRLLHTSIPKIVNLVLNLQDGLPMVEADSTQLRQVVMNLVINAAEAIPENTPGTVTVTTTTRKLTEEDKQHAVIPLLAEEEQYVVLDVADTGVGIKPEVQSRIFDPFFTTKFVGRGLGLSAVLGIVKAHKGGMTFKTAPGVGTTFSLMLPAAASQASLPMFREEARTRRRSGTVLVVDDEALVRAVAQRTLEYHGYDVLLAGEGRESIQILAANPDIVAIVLDLAMPVMTGDQTAPRLRSINPTVPIILSSGYSETEARQRFAGIGITAFLQKPYEAGLLLEKIETSISGSDSK